MQILLKGLQEFVVETSGQKLRQQRVLCSFVALSSKAHALNQINKGFLILCLWINYWPFSPKCTLCKDFNKYTSVVVDKTLFFLQRNKFSGERILTRCRECSLGIFRIRFLYDIFIDSAFSATHLLTCFTLVELLSDLNLSL